MNVCYRKTDTDEERKKRQAEDQGDAMLHQSKRRCVDESVDLCIMEDVINLMEDMISKVADNEAYVPEEPYETECAATKSGTLSSVTARRNGTDVVVISDDSGDSRRGGLKLSLEKLKGNCRTGKCKAETFPPKLITNLKSEPCSPSNNEDDRQNNPYFDIPLDMVVESGDDDDGYGLAPDSCIKTEVISDKTTAEGLPDDIEVAVKKENGQEVPEETVLVRRSSQESTTTTTTTTTKTETSTSAAESSDSSDDSSSSERDDDSSSSGSSDSSDSSDSDSEDPNRSTGTVLAAESEKKDEKSENLTSPLNAKMAGGKKVEDTNNDHFHLIKSCLVALEECVLRFPHHYKSLYRLTHYYFHSKFHRNVTKCRELLLGIYSCLPSPNRPSGSNFQGLFADRKSNNFFNGVWRIPVPEIDRPGCFASHMSRCVLLLMDVLRELHEHSLLLELCVALRRNPEPDKKYLRESEREQLSRQALSLSLQTLRAKLRDEITSALVLEVYRTYQYVQKQLPHKEGTFSALLKDVCRRYVKADSCTLEQAVRICQQEIVRVPCNPSGGPTQSVLGQYQQASAKGSPAPVQQPVKKPAPPSAPPQTTAPKVTSTPPPAPRPRGRPPGSTRAAAQATALPVPPFPTLKTMFNDPQALRNISSMLDPINAVMQAQMTGLQAELLLQLAANSVAPIINPLAGLSNTGASSTPGASRDRHSVSILPVSTSTSAASKSNTKMSTVQSKISTASSVYGKGAPRAMPAATNSSIPQIPKTPSTNLQSYPVIKDHKYASQSSVDMAPPRKFSESSLPGSISQQIGGPMRKNFGKSIHATIITYKQDMNSPVKSAPTSSSDKTTLSNFKTSGKTSSSNVGGKGAYKSQSSESKDPTYYPRNQNSESSRNTLGRANSRSSLISGSSRNVLNDIPASHSAGMSLLNRLQQHSSQLEIIHKPKNPPLDLPSSVSIPSSITITPKKCNQPINTESRSPKKMKDTVSIVEIGNSAQKGKSTGQNVMPKNWSPAAPSSTPTVREKEVEGEVNVEVITLE